MKDLLVEKKRQLTEERAALAEIHRRAVDAANNAFTQIVRLDAQVALLEDLEKSNG